VRIRSYFFILLHSCRNRFPLLQKIFSTPTPRVLLDPYSTPYFIYISLPLLVYCLFFTLIHSVPIFYSSDCLKYGQFTQPSFPSVNDAVEHFRQRALWIGDKLILNSSKQTRDHDVLPDGSLEFQSVKVPFEPDFT